MDKWTDAVDRLDELRVLANHAEKLTREAEDDGLPRDWVADEIVPFLRTTTRLLRAYAEDANGMLCNCGPGMRGCPLADVAEELPSEEKEVAA